MEALEATRAFKAIQASKAIIRFGRYFIRVLFGMIGASTSGAAATVLDLP